MLTLVMSEGLAGTMEMLSGGYFALERREAEGYVTVFAEPTRSL